MRLIVFVLLASMVMLGCAGGGGEQPQNATNLTNQSNQSAPIQIIIGNQTNQTNARNITQEQNQTPPPPAKDLEYTYEPDKPLGIYFIDVGQPGEHGDAILIKKGDFNMLVDAGPADAGQKVVDFLKNHEVDQIQVLVSTNADPRHYGGISAVSQQIQVQQLWWSGLSEGDAGYASLMNDVGNRTRRVRTVSDGFTMDLDGMNVTVLNPQLQGTFKDPNNDAVVLRLVDGNFSALLTSGIQTGAQGKLINEKPSLIRTTVMQAPYYGVGAGTSNIGLFLVTAKPSAIVISGSSDESAANGGSRDPFRRLMQQYGIAWYENYVNGTVRISTDGSNYTIMPLGTAQ
jgi:competence protein ComEC